MAKARPTTVRLAAEIMERVDEQRVAQTRNRSQQIEHLLRIALGMVEEPRRDR